ncbi:MAG: glutamate formiminotransferase [Candidatus Dormibacteraeota bacterium]|nr:glutamate formiminotransferase [Candidatus Dormibacteraeota bacterium]
MKGVGESLFESVPNFSEGRDDQATAAIAGAARQAHVLDVDPDPDHNRTVVSLAGLGTNVVEALISSVAVAVERIDVREHRGVHPRIGAADVVPIVPLGVTTMAESRDLALTVGARIWDELGVPVYFYGEHQSLADIRGGRGRLDLGGPSLHPSAGAVCVGARAKLVAFNVIMGGVDVIAARSLARSVRERAGGIRGVQALAFELPGGRVQLSMNLFRLDETSPQAVVAELERRGVTIVSAQLVGLCPATIAGPAAAGRLLEARLAAAAARAGAERCADRGGAEHAALATRLRREADALARLGADQGELLAGAERAAALVPVLRAAGVLDVELQALLEAAAAGLRDAITTETSSAYTARIAALDRRLGPATGRAGE